WWWAVDNIQVTGWNMIPVELTSFTANASNGNVVLNWSTATETNNRGFEVQRKTANSQFQKVGFVAGSGTTSEIRNYSYSDDNLTSGDYTYRLKQIDLDGTSKYSNEVEVQVSVPAEFALEQNYPNPFNPSTVIKYSIPADQQVKLNVYNLLGENVMTLVNRVEKAGQHEVNFNASNLASGVYFYKLEAGTNTSIKKMILMK
ncbi:MAG TPA: T9SS type A sorting domain-containing protein, partial [Ignavibacteriaceae bacterium]